MKVIDAKNSAKDGRSPFNVAIVVSRFNSEVTEKLFAGAKGRLKELGFGADEVTACYVPGAIEIPLAAQRLAQIGVYDAIICLGAVIRGETGHYDYVCEQVSQGCQHVALQNDLPVVFGVLTTDNEAQAMERAGGSHGNKGIDAVDTAVEMVAVLRQIV